MTRIYTAGLGLLASAIALSLGAANQAVAQSTLYWDNNGTTAGTNPTTASGNWGTAAGRWTTTADGTGTPAAWVANSIAEFSAGSVDAENMFPALLTITVDSTGGGPSFDVAGIVLDAGEGNLAFTGGTGILNMASGSQITAPAGQSIAPGNVTLAGTNLVFNCAGTVVMTNAANTYTGTTISAGTVTLDSDANLGAIGGTLTFAGGKLTSTTAARTGASAIPHAINVTANSSISTTSTGATPEFAFTTNSYTVTPGAVLTFVNDSTGTFKPRMSGDGFTYTGNIVLDNGALLGKTELNVFNTAGNTNTISGNISGAGGFTRSASSGLSAGTTVLSGANTYTGTTAVNAGTLLVNGTHTGGASYTVAAGFSPPATHATLGGSGTITLAAGANVSVTGNLAPGNAGVGTLTINLASATEKLDLNGATAPVTPLGNLKFELGTPAASDKVKLGTGTLDVGMLDFADFTFSNAGGLAAGSYTLFDAPAGTTTLGTIGTASGTIDSFTGTLSIVANDVILTVTGVGANNADFNSDGIVDGTDFLTWQKGLGLIGQMGKINGNANADTVIDQQDLGVWVTKFGGPGATAAAGTVPEPASFGLGVMALLGLAGLRRGVKNL